MVPICTPFTSEFGFACASAPTIDVARLRTVAAGSPAIASFPNSRLVYDMCPSLFGFVQCKCVQRVPGGNEEVLSGIDHVGFRRVRQVSDARVPQRFAVRRIARDDISSRVAREQQLACRGQNTGAVATTAT